ncbi:pantetheinase-like [Uloborus diversus]|uniref:pantetheinase-like n=1 Tax=Uloborus diversus TaxID=327109 RepID=UPI00240A64E3|nr:pantetheinase-like [Uloborus diversus]
METGNVGRRSGQGRRWSTMLNEDHYLALTPRRHRSKITPCAVFILLPVLAFGKDYFTAAVFEHRPRGEFPQEPKTIITNNLRFYDKAAKVAAEKGTDIILFNEYGIFPYVLKDTRDNMRQFMEYIPDPKKIVFNPCVEEVKDRTILYTLSCIARSNKIYVVANMGDIQPCEGTCDSEKVEECSVKCPSDDVFMYNTDVAFDREGNLVAKYHKGHLYMELLNTPEPEFVTFKTDFGVFGMIVCFDSVFQESVMLAEQGIDTLLFPTFWFDDVFALNAVEWQQSWALANKVNFFAANTQTPGLGSLGSGIYSKFDGALVYTYDPDGESKLLIANVKLREDAKVDTKPSIIIIDETSVNIKDETGINFPDICFDKIVGEASNLYKDYRCFESLIENYTLVKLTDPSGKVEACHGGFCCSLAYTADDMQEDFYFAAFSGINILADYYQWCEETCLLIRCDPHEGKPCALFPPNSKTVFRSLEIRGRFSSEKIFPTVSKNKHRLAPKSEWYHKISGTEAKLKFRSQENVPLLKAGFLGRCYKRDPPFVPIYEF